MSSKFVVKQKEGEEIPVEIIATSIKEISDGMKKLRAGRLNDRALIYLIHKSSGVAQETIKTVLNSIQNLERDFLK